MLAPMPIASADAQRLAKILKQLSDQDRKTVLDFADYLAQRNSTDDNQPVGEPQQPLALERPQQESVVSGIKRLRENYPMIDPDQVLHQTADLMQAHLVGGREPVEVIDDLEALFADKYSEYLESFSES